MCMYWIIYFNRPLVLNRFCTLVDVLRDEMRITKCRFLSLKDIVWLLRQYGSLSNENKSMIAHFFIVLKFIFCLFCIFEVTAMPAPFWNFTVLCRCPYDFNICLHFHTNNFYIFLYLCVYVFLLNLNQY